MTSMTCRPHLITSDASKCIPHSDIIFIAGLPIHINPQVLKQVLKQGARHPPSPSLLPPFPTYLFPCASCASCALSPLPHTLLSLSPPLLHLTPPLQPPLQIKPHLPSHKKVFIGSVCAYGGFDWVAHSVLQNCCDYSLFGTQLIPWCCGTLQYGKTGLIIGGWGP